MTADDPILDYANNATVVIATTASAPNRIQKRRAKAGERPVFNLDVIVYAPENWLHRNRITVRDKATGHIEEQKGYIVSFAIERAVNRLIKRA